MQNRIDWVDQVKGLAIFLVVYGHNYPFTEKYIYTFHMPLFFMVSGFFFPAILNNSNIKKRAYLILGPYFIWATFLFAFWALIGRKMGESGGKQLSVLDNFLGIFYSQGDAKYMDWGMPLWFLPAIFLCFLYYFMIKKFFSDKISIAFAVLILSSLGFLITRITDLNFPWSINVALVALFFFAFGNLTFNYIQKISKKWDIIIIIISFSIHLLLYNFNEKIDMYRSGFGNEILFLTNGLLGSIYIIFFFKRFPYFKFLSVVGKFTLLILVFHFLAMSVIKLFLWQVVGDTEFVFSETQKFFFAVLQIIMIYPLFLVINKYFPLLNGTSKKV